MNFVFGHPLSQIAMNVRITTMQNISLQGSRNSESDFVAFTLSSCLLLCVIIVKLPWGQPFERIMQKPFQGEVMIK
jgi:hypothetical protein